MIRFEAEPVNARTNQRKHGVSFEDTMHVFEDSRDLAGERLCCSSHTPFE